MHIFFLLFSSRRSPSGLNAQRFMHQAVLYNNTLLVTGGFNGMQLGDMLVIRHYVMKLCVYICVYVCVYIYLRMFAYV